MMTCCKKRFLSGILLICMMLSMFFSNSAKAVVMSSDYLDWYRGVTTAVSGGDIVVTASVDGCGDMTKIGASKVVLYESSDGISFRSVGTYKYEDYPDMMGTGWTFHRDVVTYEGTPGYAYYSVVYCYAGNSKGYDEKPYTTAVVYARG